jgi:hypothetical protein
MIDNLERGLKSKDDQGMGRSYEPFDSHLDIPRTLGIVHTS